jgi:hypothetical protein
VAPLATIVPTVESPPVMSFTAQTNVSPELEAPVIAAEKTCAAPVARLALPGDKLMVIVVGVVGCDVEELAGAATLPHAASSSGTKKQISDFHFESASGRENRRPAYLRGSQLNRGAWERESIVATAQGKACSNAEQNENRWNLFVADI